MTIDPLRQLAPIVRPSPVQPAGASTARARMPNVSPGDAASFSGGMDAGAIRSFFGALSESGADMASKNAQLAALEGAYAAVRSYRETLSDPNAAVQAGRAVSTVREEVKSAMERAGMTPGKAVAALLSGSEAETAAGADAAERELRDVVEIGQAAAGASRGRLAQSLVAAENILAADVSPGRLSELTWPPTQETGRTLPKLPSAQELRAAVETSAPGRDAVSHLLDSD